MFATASHRVGLTSAPPQSFQALLRDRHVPLSDCDGAASMAMTSVGRRIPPPQPRGGVDDAGDVYANRSVGPPSSSAQASSSSAMSSSSLSLSTGTSVLAPPTSSDTVAKPKRKRVRIKTARRREQCRVNQARYRENQKSVETTLGVTVAQLRREIQALVAQRQLLDGQRLTTHNAVRKTVAALFNAMRHGLTTDANRTRQLAVITATNHPDVHVDDGRCGHAAVIEQWHCFSTFWGGIRMQLCRIDSVHVDDDDNSATVRSAVRMELTVTPQTIQYVFPHLMRAPHLNLQRQLLGQRLVCDVVTTHVIDATHRITHAPWTVDFVAALLPFVSIDEAAIVLHIAKIERDAYLREPTAPVVSDQALDYRRDHRHRPPQRYPPGRRFEHLEWA